MTDIAVELGMGPANVYRFFPSKDAIKEAVCMRVMDQVVDIRMFLGSQKNTVRSTYV